RVLVERPNQTYEAAPIVEAVELYRALASLNGRVLVLDERVAERAARPRNVLDAYQCGQRHLLGLWRSVAADATRVSAQNERLVAEASAHVSSARRMRPGSGAAVMASRAFLPNVF